VMLLITAVGLLCGFVAIVLLPFARQRVAVCRLGMTAVIIGISSPLFFLVVVGGNFGPLAYVITVSPLSLGVVAVAVCPKSVVQPRGFEVLPKDNGRSEEE
jgi:hypothetical protein